MMTIMIMVSNCQRRRRTYHNDKSPFQKDVPQVKTASTDSGETSARTAVPEGPDAVWQRFKERKRVLDSGCPQYLQQRGEIKRWFTGLYLSISQKVFYCPIEKTGSTEWRLLLRNVSNHGVTVKTRVKWFKKNVRLATTMSYYTASNNIQQSRLSAETRTLSVSLSSSYSSSS